MTRRGVYQLELAAIVTMVGAIVLVTLLAVMTIESQDDRGTDLKVKPPGLVSINSESMRPIHYIGLGAGGCATASCHGGVRTPDHQGRPQEDEWKTSAFVFLQQDPHAQAFNVLFEERSREMIYRLDRAGGLPPEDRSDVDWYIGQLQEKCVSCHATPLPEGTPVTPEAGLNHYALGVTCEACHGPASRWGDEHLSKSWTTNRNPSNAVKPALDKKATGFNELDQLPIAAVACSKCHVGDGSQVDGKSYREVTHDLIAAGHPRLDFDFAAWYASMPKHWNRHREEQPTFHIDAWLIGQISSLRTREASLLTIQRDSAGQNREAIRDLARYDCFACHRALTFPPTARETISGDSKSPIPFGSGWKILTHFQPEEVQRFSDGFTSLNRGESTSFTDRRPEEIHLQARLPSADFAMRIEMYPGKENLFQSFDELVSFYYAADAVKRDAAFSAKAANDFQPAAKELDDRLKALKRAMEAYLTSSDQISRYVSPRGFGATKTDNDVPVARAEAVQTALVEVQSALREIAQEWPKEE